MMATTLGIGSLLGAVASIAAPAAQMGLSLGGAVLTKSYDGLAYSAKTFGQILRG